MTFTLLVPAAGSGSRFGYELPKTLIEISGKPLFVHAVSPMLEFSTCQQVILAAPTAYLSTFRSIVKQYFPALDIRVVAGGATRQDSVGLALDHVLDSVDLVLIHDAARPLIKRELIERTIAAVEGPYVAAVPALPVTDTIKRAAGNPLQVTCSIERSGLFAVQTPQVILRSVAIRAHELARKSGFQGTDDTSLIEEFKLGDVRLVDGDPENIKLTTREDLERVRERL